MSDEVVAQDSEWAEQAKAIFKKYDENGDGSISEDELEGILTAISGSWEKAEVKALLKEADANRNGLIEFDEFINWLVRPVGDGAGRAVLNYGEAFKILFDVYDKDGSGSIQKAEFAEAHSIMQGALRISESEAEEGHKVDPLDLQKDLDEAFGGIDTDGGGTITLLEFIKWMQSRVPAHMKVEDLADICKHVADMLQDLYYHMELAEEGYIKESDSHILEGVIKKLADATRAMDKRLGGGAKVEEVKSQWTEPPMGLSVDRLKAAHMGFYVLPPRRLKKVDWEVMCLPLPGEYESPDKRTWLGGVIRRIHWKSGKDTVEEVHWYVYDRETFSWKILSTECYDYAWKGIDTITPGIAIFCCLKTQANFGTKLNWDGISHSLDGSVDLGYISQEQKAGFEAKINEVVTTHMEEDGMSWDTLKAKKKYVQDYIDHELVMKPREVMGLLSGLGFVDIDPAWQDFV